MGGMSRGRDDIWGLILLSEAWWTAPCGGRRAADEGQRLAAPPRGLADRPGVPRMLGGIWGCILFKLKEYTPRPPKKNSGGVSIPPPDPLWASAPTGGRGKTSSTTLDGVRRRSRFAARRIVEAADRSWQRNGGLRPRPPSSGNSKKGPGPLPGFRRLRRKE